MSIVIRPSRLTRSFDATSQWLNTVLLNGNPNESISGRAYREGWKKTEWVINTLLFWDINHCYWAYINDIARAELMIKEHALFVNKISLLG